MKMLAGEIPTIYGDGEQSRDFTFIQNVVHGNLLASEAPAERVSGKVLNIATGNRVTLNQTVEILRRATGYTGEVRYAAERSGDVKHSLADISRAKNLLATSRSSISTRASSAQSPGTRRPLRPQMLMQGVGDDYFFIGQDGRKSIRSKRAKPESALSDGLCRPAACVAVQRSALPGTGFDIDPPRWTR